MLIGALARADHEGHEGQVDQEGDDLDKTPEVVNTSGSGHPVKEAETFPEKPEEKKSGNRRLWNFFSKMIQPRDVVADKNGKKIFLSFEKK